jgi:hypothetical protein
MEVRAIEASTLIGTKRVRPTVEDAIVRKPIPLSVVFIATGLSKSPVTKSDAASTAEGIILVEMLRPLVVSATPKDRQVRVN